MPVPFSASLDRVITGFALTCALVTSRMRKLWDGVVRLTMGAVMDMDRFSLVLLRRPPNAPELPEAQLDALQERHVVFMGQMRERGAMVASGPFDAQPDPSWRGMCLYRTNIEETRRLAAEDPAVRAGRLAIEVFTWCVPAGLLPR